MNLRQRKGIVKHKVKFFDNYFRGSRIKRYFMILKRGWKYGWSRKYTLCTLARREFEHNACNIMLDHLILICTTYLYPIGYTSYKMLYVTLR